MKIERTRIHFFSDVFTAVRAPEVRLRDKRRSSHATNETNKSKICISGELLLKLSFWSDSVDRFDASSTRS